MKILYYSPIFHPTKGGGALIPYKLAIELSKIMDVKVITYTDFRRKNIVKKSKIVKKSRNLEIIYVRPIVINISHFPQIFSLKMIYYFLKEASDSDIIHMFGSYHHISLFLLSLIAVFLGKPIIFTPFAIHEDLKFFKSKKILFLAKLFFLPMRNAIINVITKFDIECLKEFGLTNNKVYVIPHPFDFVPILNEKKDENLILSVGRFDWNKGQDALLYIMEKVIKRLPTAKLIIAGHVTKPYFYQKVLNLRKKLGLEKNVKIIPNVSRRKLIKLYNKASIFVFPSIADSYGMVNLEAMSVGLPVVANNVGGVSEIVKNGNTGFLVDVRNHEKFAELILKLLKNEKLREKIGKNAAKYTKRFSWKEYTKKIIRIYKLAKFLKTSNS